MWVLKPLVTVPKSQQNNIKSRIEINNMRKHAAMKERNEELGRR